MEQSYQVNQVNEKVTLPDAVIPSSEKTNHGVFTFIGETQLANRNGFETQPAFDSQPEQPITTRIIAPQKNTNDSYCGRLYRNRNQTISIAGGLLLMLNSGLHIGWGIWRIDFTELSVDFSIFTFILMTWSIGAFFGGFIGSILTSIYRKDVSYYISAGGMFFGNLLFIIWDEHSEAITAGRLLIGGAHGIAYVALIAHAGENAAKNMRGTILSTVNFMLYTGIFMSVVITGTVTFNWFYMAPENLSGERIIGIVGVLLAAIACAKTMSVETIPFLLHRNNRFVAMINLKNLRDSPDETLELTQEMEEFELMVVQDRQNNGNIFTNGNGKPLMQMIMLRLMVALTNNYFINFVAISSASQLFTLNDFGQQRLVPLIVVAPRLAMSIMQIFYADIFKRKIQIIISATLAAVLVIVVGILLNTLNLAFYNYMTINIVFAILWLVFQFACGIGMDQMQDVYLSEAFSTAKKPWSIAFVVGIEHMFHIFMIGMFYFFVNSGNIFYIAHWNAFIFVTGSVIFLFGLIIFFALPETRRMSLKQAKDAFLNRSVNMYSPFS